MVQPDGIVTGWRERVGLGGAVAVEPRVLACRCAAARRADVLTTPVARSTASGAGLEARVAEQLRGAAATGGDRPGEGRGPGRPSRRSRDGDLEVPAVVGVPEIRPLDADRQAGGQAGGA